jgi:hypothetical protein
MIQYIVKLPSRCINLFFFNFISQLNSLDENGNPNIQKLMRGAGVVRPNKNNDDSIIESITPDESFCDGWGDGSFSNNGKSTDRNQEEREERERDNKLIIEEQPRKSAYFLRKDDDHDLDTTQNSGCEW